MRRPQVAPNAGSVQFLECCKELISAEVSGGICVLATTAKGACLLTGRKMHTDGLGIGIALCVHSYRALVTNGEQTTDLVNRLYREHAAGKGGQHTASQNVMDEWAAAKIKR
jgi:hypothetical protein